MIGKLVDSTLKTVVDTIGVLIVASIVVLGTTAVMTQVLGMMNVSGDTLVAGSKISSLIGTGMVLIIGTLMLHERKLTNDILSIVLVVGGVWLAHTSGLVLGLIPIALLTTLKGGIK
jgi:hypothetical protein